MNIGERFCLVPPAIPLCMLFLLCYAIPFCLVPHAIPLCYALPKDSYVKPH